MLPTPRESVPSTLTPPNSPRELRARRLLAARVESCEPALDDARPAFVVAAHPRDETLACGGVIARKVAAGAEVHVIFLTSGELSHVRFVPPEVMAVIREREALAACSRLGVPATNVHFLRCPDGGGSGEGPRATREIASLLATHRPSDLFLPDRGDRHPDIATASRAGRAALRQSAVTARIVEYPFWAWRIWPFVRLQPPLPWMGLHETSDRATVIAASVRRRFGRSFTAQFPVSVAIGGTLQVKEHALAAHESQMVHRDGDPAWWILHDLNRGDFLRCFFRGPERFRVGAPRARS